MSGSRSIKTHSVNRANLAEEGGDEGLGLSCKSLAFGRGGGEEMCQLQTFAEMYGRGGVVDFVGLGLFLGGISCGVASSRGGFECTVWLADTARCMEEGYLR